MVKRNASGRAEKAKASVRAKVEHPFRYVKRMFGYKKVRYRGLAKNTQRISLLEDSANKRSIGEVRKVSKSVLFDRCPLGLGR